VQSFFLTIAHFCGRVGPGRRLNESYCKTKGLDTVSHNRTTTAKLRGPQGFSISLSNQCHLNPMFSSWARVSTDHAWWVNRAEPTLVLKDEHSSVVPCHSSSLARVDPRHTAPPAAAQIRPCQRSLVVECDWVVISVHECQGAVNVANFMAYDFIELEPGVKVANLQC